MDRGSRWGLSGEVLRRKRFDFPTNRLPNHKEIIKFLEKELLKDIDYVDLS